MELDDRFIRMSCYCLPFLLFAVEGKIINETEAANWIEQNDIIAKSVYHETLLASWTYSTNITEHNEALQLNASMVRSQFQLETANNASQFDWENFQNETLKRMFQGWSDIGSSALLDRKKFAEYESLVSEMKVIYSLGKVCMEKQTDCLSLEPGLTRILRTSRDPDELLLVWRGWRDATGPKIKPLYEKFVQLENEIAAANGFKDNAERWIARYETDSFADDIEALYKGLSPLYDQLHAFVRRTLTKRYGEDIFPKSGHIPAHLLGNMWAQSWSNILDLVQPYKDKASVDVTPEMVKQNYTARRMFKISEEFFTSLGLIPMPDSFWNLSMITKPDDREVVCHASAWSFYMYNDVRIKQCTDVTMEDLITVHHEMGHTEYYLQYAHQPVVFQSGANPGFHEALGDALALSVVTPDHLAKIGLLASPPAYNDSENDINFLLSMALDKIAFIPFSYIMDKWRWRVFRGEITPADYNRQWWKLRCKYQGISPPAKRSEEDFDPGAKYHIPANTPYIRYFVSHVIQFQFLKALCDAANFTGPLHRCDIYRSKEAGTKLSGMMKLGSSKPWQDAMEALTGQRKMDVSPLIAYFKPLIDWLQERNKGYDLGWDEGCPKDFISAADRAPPKILIYLTIFAYACRLFLSV